VDETSRNVNISTGNPEEGRDADLMNQMNWLLMWHIIGSLEHLTELKELQPILTNTAVPLHTTWSSEYASRCEREECRGKGDCDRLPVDPNLDEELMPEELSGEPMNCRLERSTGSAATP
jgi:hypothetical protein